MPTVQEHLARAHERCALASDGVYLFLLELQLPTGTVLRLARNTEDVEWPTGSGQVWQALAFDLDDIDESSRNEVRQLTLKVGNGSNALLAYLEELEEWRKLNGRDACRIILRCVNSALLAQTEPLNEWEFEDEGASLPAPMDWAFLRLGVDRTHARAWPRRRILRDYCSWERPEECPHVANCNRTLARCREIDATIDPGRVLRFGGFPIVERGGLYA